jgi:ABC-2 type transport system ATP-binding protein
MLSIRDLKKHYENFDIENVSFDIPKGAVVGLIGENGAGKSTVIKCILGAVHPDGGQILFDGKEIRETCRKDRQKIAFVFDDTGLPLELDLGMLDKVLCRIYDKWDTAKFRSLIREFSLPRDKMLKDFSKGMKMKAAIAVAFSYDSDVLILDEPTSGLDPVVRDEIIEMIYNYNQNCDRSVLLSSHITADLEKICDYIVYIHEGRIIFNEEKDELLNRYAIYSIEDKHLRELNKSAFIKVLKREYRTEILAQKDKMPKDFEYKPVTLDEMMLFYSKGEDVCRD